jgi:hypothetical protein
MKFIKQNLLWIICAALGLFNFILLAIPYVAVVVDLGEWGELAGIRSRSGISGYNLLSAWELGFGGVMSALFQIFVLLAGIALLAIGVAGILKGLNAFKIPDKLGKFELTRIGKLLLFAYAGLNVLMLIFVIILCATNGGTDMDLIGANYRISAGIFITLVFAIGALVAYMMLNKKFSVPPAPATETSAPVQPQAETADVQQATSDEN